MATKVSVIGSGMVGVVLANGFVKYGYEVMLGTNSQGKIAELKSKTNAKVKIGSFQETAAFGEIVVLATKGDAAESVAKSLAASISGKVVIDTTNPIADAPPVNGVLQFFTPVNTSLMERLQAAVPGAHFVKAFSCVGNAFMVDPDFNGQKPTMFICGNNTAAKETVKSILTKFGWEYEDMGMVEAARSIEPLAILWCIPGISGNRWTHAFKLLKK